MGETGRGFRQNIILSTYIFGFCMQSRSCVLIILLENALDSDLLLFNIPFLLCQVGDMFNF